MTPTPDPSPQGGGGKSRGLHTLYISPLKALAVDIARNLEMPIAQMKLPIKVETRTGDTPVSRRTRQRKYPPDILLTTPEQLALLLASDDAPYLFRTLKRIVLDELHALVTSKRGDLLSLGLARLWTIAPAGARDRALGDGRRPGKSGAVSGAAEGKSAPHPPTPPHHAKNAWGEGRSKRRVSPPPVLTVGRGRGWGAS